MFKRSLLICSLLFSSISSQATPKVEATRSKGYYLGAQGGIAMHYPTSDASYTNHRTILFSTSTSYGTAHTQSSQNLAGRIFFGYMFNQNIGLETGFDYLGQQYFVIHAPSEEHSERYNMSINLSIVGQYELSPQFLTFIKAGYGLVSGGFLDNDSEGVRAELGLGYRLSNHLMLTASYAHFFLSDHTISPEIHTYPLGGTDINATPVGLASLGLSYQF